MPALLVTAKNSLKLQKREETQKKRGKKGGKIRIRLLNDIYPKKVSLGGHIDGSVGLKLLSECVKCLLKERLKKWKKSKNLEQVGFQRGLLGPYQVKIDFSYRYDLMRSCTCPVCNKKTILKESLFADLAD